MSTGNIIVLPFTTGAGIIRKINNLAFYSRTFEPFNKRLFRVLWLILIVTSLLKLFVIVVLREFGKVIEWLICLSSFSEDVYNIMPNILHSKKD